MSANETPEYSIDAVAQAAYDAGLTLPIHGERAIPSGIEIIPEDQIWLDPPVAHHIAVLARAVAHLTSCQTCLVVRGFDSKPHICMVPGRGANQPDIAPHSMPPAPPAMRAAMNCFESVSESTSAAIDSLVRGHAQGAALRLRAQDSGGVTEVEIATVQQQVRCPSLLARATRDIVQYAAWYVGAHEDASALYRFVPKKLVDAIVEFGDDLARSIYVRHREMVAVQAKVIGFADDKSLTLRSDERIYTVSVDPSRHSARHLAKDSRVWRVWLIRYTDVGRLGCGRERYELADVNGEDHVDAKDDARS